VSACEEYAQAHKTARYAKDVEAEGYVFVPGVVDAYGNWCEAGRLALADVAKALSLRDGRKVGLHLKLLLQKCAVAIQLSNARALLQRCDPGLIADDGLTADGAYDDADDESEFVAPDLTSIRAAADCSDDAEPE